MQHQSHTPMENNGTEGVIITTLLFIFGKIALSDIAFVATIASALVTMYVTIVNYTRNRKK